MAKHTYTCYSNECNDREFSESRADLAVCTHCGSSNIKRKSRNKRALLMIPLIGLIGMGAWQAFDSLARSRPPFDDNTDCKLVAINQTKISKCGYQIDPVFQEGCRQDTIFWWKNGEEQLPILASLGQLDVDGDVELRFALNAQSLTQTGAFKELSLTCNPQKMSPAEQKAENQRLEAIIQASVLNPFGPEKYDAFNATKSLPDSTVRLPDGRFTSGISWQNLLLLLWPDEQLKSRVTIDEYGDITNIYFSK
jgi:hypothetical protein